LQKLKNYFKFDLATPQELDCLVITNDNPVVHLIYSLSPTYREELSHIVGKVVIDRIQKNSSTEYNDFDGAEDEGFSDYEVEVAMTGGHEDVPAE
jgi:hypothetical protein